MEKLSKLQKLVMKTSQRLKKYPRTVPGRMLFISFNASELSELDELRDLFRAKFRSTNEAHVIALACRHFIDSIADEEGIDEE